MIQKHSHYKHASAKAGLMMKGEVVPVYPSHFLPALEMPCMHRAQDPPAEADIVEEDPGSIQARPPSNLRRPSPSFDNYTLSGKSLHADVAHMFCSVSYTHLRAHRDRQKSRMPSSA